MVEQSDVKAESGFLFCFCRGQGKKSPMLPIVHMPTLSVLELTCLRCQHSIPVISGVCSTPTVEECEVEEHDQHPVEHETKRGNTHET